MPDWNESTTVLRLHTGGGHCTYGPTLWTERREHRWQRRTCDTRHTPTGQ